MKTIGILGGMGPEATAAVYLNIVRIFQRRFGARFDADFPHMLIDSLPVPDVVQQVENEAGFIQTLRGGAIRLEDAGAQFLIIACNTAQKYLPQIMSAVSIPIIDLVLEVAEAVAWRKYSRAGLLGTEATIRDHLYDGSFQRRGIELLTPEPAERVVVTRAIMEILAGSDPEVPRADLLPILESLRERGAEAVVLGCTELPLVLHPGDSPVELIDTIQILAEAAVRECRTPTAEFPEDE